MTYILQRCRLSQPKINAPQTLLSIHPPSLVHLMPPAGLLCVHPCAAAAAGTQPGCGACGAGGSQRQRQDSLQCKGEGGIQVSGQLQSHRMSLSAPFSCSHPQAPNTHPSTTAVACFLLVSTLHSELQCLSQHPNTVLQPRLLTCPLPATCLLCMCSYVRCSHQQTKLPTHPRIAGEGLHARHCSHQPDCPVVPAHMSNPR
jgi:hypothetical protein